MVQSFFFFASGLRDLHSCKTHLLDLEELILINVKNFLSHLMWDMANTLFM